MKINNNAKKLSTLSKMSIKSLTVGQTLAWFLVQGKPKQYFFYVDRKNAVAQKYKDPKILRKLLAKFKIDNVDDITDQAELLAGSVAMSGENLEVLVTVKRNGAGASLFKKVLKDAVIKKIMPNASVVKSLSEAKEDNDSTQEPKKKQAWAEKTPEQEREEELERMIEERREEDELERQAEMLKLNDEQKKALKIHKWSLKVSSDWASLMANEKNEDFFHQSLRRLQKFQKKKMYKHFEKLSKAKKFFGSKHPLEVEAKNLLLTQGQLPVYIKTCEQKINTIEMGKNWTDEEQLVAELFDENTFGKVEAFEEYLKNEKFKTDEVVEIINAFGVDSEEDFKNLYKACSSSRKELIFLCQKLASNDWVYFRNLLDQIEI
ncbi:MAG: hypothetical protein CL916_12860 [Deltaproteobacteria bacterium]|nr:hypothetical protein [Deltaproteobacteria bacterium]